MRKGQLISVSKIIDEKIETLANKMVGQNLKTVKKKISKEKSKEQLIKVKSK